MKRITIVNRRQPQGRDENNLQTELVKIMNEIQLKETKGQKDVFKYCFVGDACHAGSTGYYLLTEEEETFFSVSVNLN